MEFFIYANKIIINSKETETKLQNLNTIEEFR
jgi:hypothetical protein